MFSKNDIIFYVVAGNVIALIAGLAGANLTVILFSSLLIPPIILIILRIIRWDTKGIFHKIVFCDAPVVGLQFRVIQLHCTI